MNRAPCLEFFHQGNYPMVTLFKLVIEWESYAHKIKVLVFDHVLTLINGGIYSRFLLTADALLIIKVSSK